MYSMSATAISTNTGRPVHVLITQNTHIHVHTPTLKTHTQHTRGASKLHLKQPQSQHYHSSFEFQGAMAYNRLPETIRSLSNRQAFRRAI